MDCHGHQETDWCEPTINGTEFWLDFDKEEEISNGLKDGKEKINLNRGNSIYEIDFKK
eukprot:gene4987-8585_t